MNATMLKKLITKRKNRIWEIKKTLMYDMSINDREVMDLQMEAMKLSFEVNKYESRLNDIEGYIH